MIKNLVIFLVFGFVWLFIFSIPVSRHKRLFDVGYYYFVDTQPVRWLIRKMHAVGMQELNEDNQVTEEQPSP